jgi:endonuclease YncB( thermonuclease family)
MRCPFVWRNPARLGTIALAVLLLAPARVDLARADEAKRATIVGRVERVFDGDSFVMRSGGRDVEVRVFGIDAPEKGQPWSKRARTRSRELLEGEEVVVRVTTSRDVHGRVVGSVALSGGRDYASVIVGEGLAWQYRRYSKDARIAAVEREAQRARRGLWTEKDPEPPWEYRRRRPR